MAVSLNVNGRRCEVDAPETAPLLYVLRNDLQLNSPKYGCGLGQCGACAVLIDGAPARSCTIPAGGLERCAITTLEGLAAGGLHPVQQAFIAENATQCGYCLNGMIIAVTALLRANPKPSDSEIRHALAHHLCRCGSHVEVLAAARRAAEAMAGA